MMFFGLVILGVFLYFVLNNTNGNGRNYQFPMHRNEDPLEIAKVRFAKGEISREEFEAIKNNI